VVEALNAALSEEQIDSFRQDKLTDRPLGNLTKTQIRVLQLVAAGKTNQQISEERETSIEATEAMIARMWKAMDIDSSSPGNARVLAARKYLKHAGFGELPPTVD